MPLQQMQSTAEVQRKELRGVLDAEDEDEFQVLGFAEWATTGDLLVPRDWLQERWEYYSLPESFFPSEVWPSSAYKRAMRHLQDKEFSEMRIDGRKAKYRMEEGDGYIRHVYLDVFFREDEIAVSGGDWRKTNLGFFDYDGTTQELQFHTEAGDKAEELWLSLVGQAQGLHRKMKESHNGQDLNGVLLDFVKESSTAVPLRSGGALYFFPSQYQEILEGLSQLWDELNQHKADGKKCEVVTLPVVDSENHRQMIEEKAEELINSRVETVMDGVVSRMMENEEETAEEIAEDVIEELSDVSEISAEYSALLETRLTVKRHIKSYLSSIEDEKEELASKVVEEIDL